MMTLMPVAAFAAADYQESYVYTSDANASEEINDDVKVQFDFNNDVTTETVYVWFVKDGSNVASTSVTKSENVSEKANDYGVFKN